MILTFSKEQWMLLATFLAGTASVISGYGHWADLVKPNVFAGLILQLSIAIRLTFTETPAQKDNQKEEE